MTALIRLSLGMLMSRAFRFVWILLLLGCSTDTTPTAAPRVYFALDAPLCGIVLPMQFFIDSTLVGTDTFAINASPHPRHILSRAFTTTASRHVVGARTVLGSNPPIDYVWPDTVVMLAPADSLAIQLPLYCS